MVFITNTIWNYSMVTIFINSFFNSTWLPFCNFRYTLTDYYSMVTIFICLFYFQLVFIILEFLKASMLHNTDVIILKKKILSFLIKYIFSDFHLFFFIF